MDTTATTTAKATVELPTTSATAAGRNVGKSSEDWVCFDNSMDDATSNSNIAATAAVSIKPNAELLATSNGSGSTYSNSNNTTGNSNNYTNTNTSKTHMEPTTSSTAYSFTGSALGSGSIANLNATAPSGRIDGKAEFNTNNNTNSSSSSSNNAQTKEEDNNRADDSLYECNICLDTAKDAVVSMCGHLFCWPCLHQWLETRPNRKLCPVCKAAVDKDKVIPLYGRNSVNQEDPRNKVPPRPAGQRTEPEPPQGFPGFGFGDGFHMSFGIGAFPFGFFTSSLNFGEPRPPAANRGTTQYEDEQTLSKLFLYLACMCIAWLLFA